MIFDSSVSGKQHRASRRPRVVIVEDDPALLSALQFSLEAEGYEVCAFSSQNELLARREAFLNASCLVVDYRLAPLDGLELYALLEGLGLKAPAILVTSNPDEECRRGARELGVKIIEKPLLSDDLSRMISQLVVAAG
jgi:FixJ family two-component response regulator